jgi:hypothetical protein
LVPIYPDVKFFKKCGADFNIKFTESISLPLKTRLKVPVSIYDHNFLVTGYEMAWWGSCLCGDEHEEHEVDMTLFVCNHGWVRLRDRTRNI